MSPSSTFSAGISRQRSQTMAPGILGPWRRSARAAYDGINWPVFENAAKKMSTSQFFHGSARGPGPKPISDEKCNIDILSWPLYFSILKKKNVIIFSPGYLVCKLERLVSDFRQGVEKNLSLTRSKEVRPSFHEQWRKRSRHFGSHRRSQAAAVVPGGIAPARRCHPHSSRAPGRRGATPHLTRMARCRLRTSCR